MISHLCLIFAMIIVGSSVPAGKLIVSDLPIYYSMALRFLIGTLFMYGFLKLKGFDKLHIDIKTHFIVAIQAFLGAVLFTIFMMFGLREISASSAGIISGTLPVMVLLLSVLLLRERFTLIQGVAVLAASVGVVLVNFTSDVELSSTIKGSLLVVLAVMCEAGFLLLRKKLPVGLSSLVLSFYVSLYGFIFFLPLGLGQLAYGRFDPIDIGGYILIAYYGVFITAIAYILWFKGIDRVSGVYASVYTSVMPVSAVAISWFLLGEGIRLASLFGLVLVLLAMMLLIVSVKEKR